MFIIYVDIVLLSILSLLICFSCGYCVYRIYQLRQNGQMAILLRPTKVIFSHKEESGNEQLRTVVAYQNPFTGDYCISKSRVSQGYINNVDLESPDSGVSDEYEPLNLPPLPPNRPSFQVNPVKPVSPVYDNSVIKTWKWEYTEYQI